LFVTCRPTPAEFAVCVLVTPAPFNPERTTVFPGARFFTIVVPAMFTT
jgi:hypothetical protein